MLTIETVPMLEMKVALARAQEENALLKLAALQQAKPPPLAPMQIPLAVPTTEPRVKSIGYKHAPHAPDGKKRHWPEWIVHLMVNHPDSRKVWQAGEINVALRALTGRCPHAGADTISSLMCELIKAGLIERVGVGKFRLAGKI